MATKFSEDNLPDEAYCGISAELIEDPVITPDGTTYSRKAIEEWIDKAGTNPRTREPLSKDQLYPNRAFLSMIHARRASPSAFNNFGASQYSDIPSSTASSFGDYTNTKTKTKTNWFTTIINFLMSSPGCSK